MARKRVAFSERALDDLYYIEAYISQHDPAAASRVIRSIRSSIGHLELNPLMGIREPNGNGRLLFEPRYRYAISYNVTDELVEIRYIFHPRQSRRELQ